MPNIIQSPSAFGAMNVWVILHPHHPCNGQLIQPHPMALDQVPQPVASIGNLWGFLKLQTQIWNNENKCPAFGTTVFLSYHLASSCGGSVELAASFQISIVFSDVVMSGTLSTCRFSSQVAAREEPIVPFTIVNRWMATSPLAWIRSWTLSPHKW